MPPGELAIVNCPPRHRVNSFPTTILVKAAEAQLMLKYPFTEELSANIEW